MSDVKLPFCCASHCQQTVLTFSARLVVFVCYHFQFYFFSIFFIHLRFLLSFSTPTFALIGKYGNDVKLPALIYPLMKEFIVLIFLSVYCLSLATVYIILDFSCFIFSFCWNVILVGLFSFVLS